MKPKLDTIQAVKPIVVLKPGLFDHAARDAFRDAGYYVVEHDDPDAVALVIPAPLHIGGNGVLHLAMQAIRHSDFATKRFGELMTSYLEKESRS